MISPRRTHVRAGLVVAFVFLPCFGQEERRSTKEFASEIISTSGVAGGLIAHVGCGEGELTEALRVHDRFVVHGVDRDPEKVALARRRLFSRGVHGPVSVAVWRGGPLPYAENLVNLLIVEGGYKVSLQEAFRVLCPTGVVFLRKGTSWEVHRKPYPPTMDGWTHWLHGPDGNAVSCDREVGPPGSLRWIAGPRWARHHDTVPSTSALVSAGGRVFYISDEAPACLDGSFPDRWFLVARDAFNGVLLWKKPLTRWGWKAWSCQWKGRFNNPVELPKRLVAMGDRVYTTLGFTAPLVALNAGTGALIREYEGTKGTDEILFHRGLLILSVNEEAGAPQPGRRKAIPKSVCVVDPESGRVLWRRNGFSGLQAKYNTSEPFSRLELTAGGQSFFVVDRSEILCFDLHTGQVKWKRPRPPFRDHLVMYGIRMSDQCVAVYNQGVFLFAQPEMKKRRSWHTLPGTLTAFRAADGTKVWSHTYGGWAHNWQPDVFVINGLVYVHEHCDIPFSGHDIKDKSKVPYAVIGLDLHEGRVVKRISTRKAFNVGHHHRCYREKATVRYILASRRGVEFIDVERGRVRLHHWARGACLHGVMPANGLLYLTPHPCECYIQTLLKGYVALAPARRVAPGGAPAPQKGPAYGWIGAPEAPADWPTFRKDCLRSCFSEVALGLPLHVKWRVKVGSGLTPPVCAGGMVFAAASQLQCLVALNCGDGTVKWRHLAGGRISTPPTVYRGLLLFGGADGYVRCLQAQSGHLCWQFRAAPEDRFIGAEGRLESAWPVPGSVLVQKGVAYVCAGRSSYLDGGLFLYAVDPQTGQVKEKKVLYSPDPQTGEMPPGDAFTIPGTLADVPVGDGEAVYIRAERVFGSEGAVRPHLVATGGLRDDSWFDRTRWIYGIVNDASCLVFDRDVAYGVIAYPPRHRRSAYQPVKKGYLLFARKWRREKAPATRKAKKKGRQDPTWLWQVRMPIRFEALAVTDTYLFAAGVPVAPDLSDPLAPFEGRTKGVLCVFAKTTGELCGRYELPCAPVFDGMALAEASVVVSLKNGEIICMGPAESKE